MQKEMSQEENRQERKRPIRAVSGDVAYTLVRWKKVVGLFPGKHVTT
jgi:hypothetical protein